MTLYWGISYFCEKKGVSDGVCFSEWCKASGKLEKGAPELSSRASLCYPQNMEQELQAAYMCGTESPPFHLKRNQYNPDKARLRAPSSPECPQCHLEWELHPAGWVAPEPCTDIPLPPHPSSPHPNSLLTHPPLPPQGWRTKRVFAGSRGLSFFLSFSPWKPGYYSSSL